MNGHRALSRSWPVYVGRTVVVAFVVCLSSGCVQTSPGFPEPSRAQRIRPQCESPSNDDLFFPDGTFAFLQDDGAGVRWAVSTDLAAMHEPSLSCGEKPEEAYRLLVLHAFYPQPLAIRVSRSGHVYSLVAIALSGGTRDTPFVITQRTEKAITSEQWQMLTAALRSTIFRRGSSLSIE